ncbi:sushi, von Willebrand factor type A, EGF and pentraxin domain-containing protein 1 [Trichonephila clavipes]|nr:sushi, von Willebrand factor type A, EGF and pentraxin domain-containing protein 1 [Trichonephila clavipes]
MPGHDLCSFSENSRFGRKRTVVRDIYHKKNTIVLKEVLDKARPKATKAVFLVTDGYSNGGDPRPAAKVLRDQQVEIFTFGIQNGNVRELYDMASDPPEEHSYILDSFEEFEALARRALHEGKIYDQERINHI